MSARTVEIAVSGDDGRARRGNDPIYPPISASQNVALTEVDPGKNFAIPNYNINAGFVRFDTSVIPGTATVLQAVLTMMLSGTPTSVDSRSVNFEWYPWSTITDSDWIVEVGTTANVTAISALIGGAANNFTLSNPDANIVKGPGPAFTGIRMGISGGQPTGTNEVFFRAWDHATLAAPILYVEYTGGDFVPSYVQFPKNPLRTAA